MARFLTILSLALAATCVFQWRAIGQLKHDLAAVDARARQAALLDLQGRRDEVQRVVTWIDVSRRSGGGQGVCANGALDTDTLGRWLFDTYLTERARGLDEIDARQRLFEVMSRDTR